LLATARHEAGKFEFLNVIEISAEDKAYKARYIGIDTPKTPPQKTGELLAWRCYDGPQTADDAARRKTEEVK